ncbi:hypothetical protein B484DRAFT_444072 [Ochromonadaceae sp. CCMP2298]|nr:hypothetical protein B484DRAFT_444072 [Ochromonadaceae sp. CCMP2298]
MWSRLLFTAVAVAAYCCLGLALRSSVRCGSARAGVWRLSGSESISGDSGSDSGSRSDSSGSGSNGSGSSGGGSGSGMSGISKEPKSVSKGFGGIPKPNIITPAMGRPKNPNVERFLMMYTCKLCEGRNAQMVCCAVYSAMYCASLSVSLDELEDNYLIDKDGELSVVPKAAGQPDTGVNVIDLVNIKIPSAGK